MADSASTMAGQPVGRRVVLGAPHLEVARTRRLAELGLRAGTEVVVLHRTAGRGRVLAVGETRIALDRATLEAMPVVSSPEDHLEDAPHDAAEGAPIRVTEDGDR
jgi:ferrous iron transport protein A